MQWVDVKNYIRCQSTTWPGWNWASKPKLPTSNLLVCLSYHGTATEWGYFSKGLWEFFDVSKPKNKKPPEEIGQQQKEYDRKKRWEIPTTLAERLPLAGCRMHSVYHTVTPIWWAVLLHQYHLKFNITNTELGLLLSVKLYGCFSISCIIKRQEHFLFLWCA